VPTNSNLSQNKDLFAIQVLPDLVSTEVRDPSLRGKGIVLRMAG